MDQNNNEKNHDELFIRIFQIIKQTNILFELLSLDPIHSECGTSTRGKYKK